jgi:hypothetical protein
MLLVDSCWFGCWLMAAVWLLVNSWQFGYWVDGNILNGVCSVKQLIPKNQTGSYEPQPTTQKKSPQNLEALSCVCVVMNLLIDSVCSY